jgi:ferric-dicitrate binding protein FerR (iron transport regulator)
MVNVSQGSITRRLSPGQQAQVDNSGKIKIVSNADLEAAVAWKNGLFHFNNTSLQNVMRQIARWYDVDIEYDGAIAPREFGGEISRNSNVSEVLKILELSKVHFEIEGKKIIVMP